MSLHLNLSTGKFLNSSTLFKLSDALLLDVSSGEIVMSNLLVPRVGVDLFKLASLDLNFSQRKTLTDSVSGTNLITFSRASTGTYVGSDGLIKTSPVNLLYNTTTYSNWINSGQSIQTNAAISPSGLNDAVKLVADASAGGKLSYRSATTTATNVCSVYAKAGEYTNIQLRELSAARFYVNFDLSAGTYAVPQSGSAPAGGFDFISADIQDVGNGWYRCIVVNSRVGGIAFSIAGYPDSATVTTSNPNFTGDGTSGVLLWGAQLEEGSTATTYIPTTTTISGAPRFDHDPVTGESLGLLIEESRTNNMLNSGTTAQMAATSGVIRTSGGFAAPDGSTEASRVDLPAVTGPNQVVIITEQFTGLQTNTDYTASIYLKGINGGELVYLTFKSGVPTSFVAANLTTEWQRFDIKGTTTNGTLFFNVGVDTRGGTGQANQPAQSFYAWGAQVETGSFPTSYIPTSGGTVTRAADLASIEGTNFSSWYNQSEGTVFIRDKVNPSASYPMAWVLQNTTNTNDGSVSNYLNSSGAWILDSRYNGADFDLFRSNVPGAFVRRAAGLKNDDSALALNGSITTTQIGNITASTSILYIGQRPPVYFYNGHISRLTYFPTRKTDQELIKITDGTLDPAIITYGITSAGGTFNLRSTGTVDYAVDWDSTGGYETSTSNTLAHTYTAGNYDLVVYSDGVYRPLFNNVTADVSQITSVTIGPGANLGTDLGGAWLGANNMTSFVCAFDVTSGVTSFYNTWRATSFTDFPELDFSSAITFNRAWFGSRIENFPPNMFDTTGTLSVDAFTFSWLGARLSAQSIENILVSLDTNGASNITLSIDGGTNAAKTTWSAAAVTAYDNLIVKGWTISFNA